MRTLGLVPARAGSRGVPGKNTRDFCGKPLYQWAVGIGNETCDQTLVSSDDSEIADILRPAEFARDDSPMFDVVAHALSCEARPDVVVLLQPTQPLRQVKHVRSALKLLKASDADSVVSVVRIPAHYSPDFAFRINYGRLQPFGSAHPTRRQDCRASYSRDGTVYAIRRETIESGSLYGSHCLPLIIPHSESCNIDDESDWAKAEKMKNDAL